MKEYIFDVGYQEVTIEATSEDEAWDAVQSCAPDGEPIRLVRIRNVA